MTHDAAIVALKLQFPSLDVSTDSEFRGTAVARGLWLKNAVDFGLDGEETMYMGEYARNDLLKCIESLGYFCEPYDAATIMAYPNYN
jgi:hypothetical protein